MSGDDGNRFIYNKKKDSSHLARNVTVFLVSFVIALFFLYLERAAGIGVYFHVDSFTYLNFHDAISSQGLSALPNNLYFFIVTFLDANVGLLLLLNLLAYSLTNCLIFNYVSNRFRRSGYEGISLFVKYFFLATLLFSLYRLHLSSHVLKDTLVILFVVAIVTSSVGKYPSIALLLLLRVFSALYAVCLLRGKTLYISSILVLLLGIFFSGEITLFLEERNSQDMLGRDFDVIPDFVDLGAVGAILRAMIWPILLTTGLFFLVSPSLELSPIIFDILSQRIVAMKIFGFLGISVACVISLAIIASVVNSYTAYIRYCYPVLIAMPLLLMKN